MADFKSSFMGGYKKKDVDEYIEKLEKENEKYKENAKLANQKISKAAKLQDEYKKLKSKVNELENQKLNDENEKALLAGEINNLNNQIDSLNEQIGSLTSNLAKSNKVNDNHIANIGKIFYSAYESGSEIVDDAKNGATDFLAEISKSSIEAKAEIENAIASYALINTDIKALVDTIIKNVNAVSNTTDKLIEKAKEVASSMGEIDDIRLENDSKANNIIEKYSAFFDEYQSEKANANGISNTDSSPAEEEHFDEVQNVEENEQVEEADNFVEEPVLNEVPMEVAQPEIQNENIKFEEPKPPIQVVPPVHQPVRQQRQPINQNRQPIQRRPVQVQRQAVGQSQRNQSVQNEKPTRQNSQPSQMNQNRAVMLREVLKKFQNNDEQE